MNKKTSRQPVSVKPKTSQDKKSLSRQAAAAQGTVHGQKGGILQMALDLISL